MKEPIKSLKLREIKKFANSALYLHLPTNPPKGKNKDEDWFTRYEIYDADEEGIYYFIPGKYFYRGKVREWYITFKELEQVGRYAFEFAPKLIKVNMG